MTTSLPELMRSLATWENSIREPQIYQDKLLHNLLAVYARTEYGEKLRATQVNNVEEYREHFPIATYNSIRPYLQEVERGNSRAFLSEEPVTWVMTRGSTGKSKVLPVTRAHLNAVFECGTRAVLNYALRNKAVYMLTGRVLNLNFPSNVRELDLPDRKLVYGYSSGTYARLNPIFEGLTLIPRQEEVDALMTGLTPRDWDQRFELIYQKAKGENVVCMIGVAPVQAAFGRYLKRRYGTYPKGLWKLKVIFSTSVARIQTRYSAILRGLYGEVPVVEMYTATEGAFAQQKDDLPYVVPNYDMYIFEVRTGKGMKMLHELERGEWGRLIVSTSMLPRYDIGDLVEAMGKNYFRVFGRVNRRTVLSHILYRSLFRWFL